MGLRWEIIIDLVGVIVAGVLVILSFNTLRTLKVTGIKRSVMKPVLISGSIFIVGCALSVLHDFIDIPILEILHHFSWIVALMILTYGIYIYMKMVTKV